jgi:hypothetical protein
MHAYAHILFMHYYPKRSIFRVLQRISCVCPRQATASLEDSK